MVLLKSEGIRTNDLYCQLKNCWHKRKERQSIIDGFIEKWRYLNQWFILSAKKLFAQKKREADRCMMVLSKSEGLDLLYIWNQLRIPQIYWLHLVLWRNKDKKIWKTFNCLTDFYKSYTLTPLKPWRGKNLRYINEIKIREWLYLFLTFPFLCMFL